MVMSLRSYPPENDPCNCPFFRTSQRNGPSSDPGLSPNTLTCLRRSEVDGVSSPISVMASSGTLPTLMPDGVGMMKVSCWYSFRFATFP